MTEEDRLRPQVRRLNGAFWVAHFDLMKRVPAYGIVRRARAEGLLQPGGTVVETSSGTMALGLAEVCAQDGYVCEIVIDEDATHHLLTQQIEQMGAHLHVVNRADAKGGLQRARLRKVRRLLANHPDWFWVMQYDRQWNADSYRPIAEFIRESVGRINVLVCPVGTGGSSRGLSTVLREHNPELRLLGVDTFGSVLFGQQDGPRILRGIGNSIEPANIDHNAFDEVHWVSAGVAVTGMVELHRAHQLFVGPTSGAAFVVARWAAKRDGKLCAILPDSGARYLTTFCDPEWVSQRGLQLEQAPAVPLACGSPMNCRNEWAFCNWNRRSFDEVTGRAWRADRILRASEEGMPS